MPLAFDFFLHFAYVILFLWVMAEQLGVPVPSLPLLLAAGTLTATHKLSLPLVLFAAVAGCFISDSLWFAGCRSRGQPAFARRRTISPSTASKHCW
jgi:membrane protein DedA with SNARE-associated domain